MKIHQLRFFVEVCNSGSITKAAEALHVTQPAVSQAIIELEKEHGVKLFHRTNSGLELTREGSFLLLDAKEILEKIDVLDQKMAYLGRNRHVIRLGMSPMIVIANMDYLQAYRRMHPQIHFDLFDEASPSLRRKISDGAMDLCLATGDNNGLYHCESKKLTSFEICFCVGAQHELAGRETVSWEEIVRQKLVVCKDRYQIGLVVQQQLGKHLLPTTELFQCNNTGVHINLMTNHGYCGFMYRRMVDKQPGLVGVTLEEPLYVDISLVCRTSSKKNRDIMNFIQYIQSVYQENEKGEEREQNH